MNFEIRKEEKHIEIEFSHVSQEIIAEARKKVEQGQNCLLILPSNKAFSADLVQEITAWSVSVGTDKSFKICGINEEEYLKYFEKVVDWVPSMTEARDLIYMEEVERELLGDL